MNFCEAMELLKSGKKVTRKDWKDGLYFVMEDEKVITYQPIIEIYTYNEDIMVSDGWMVEGAEKPKKFCQIIQELQNGAKAWMNDWKSEFFIYLEGGGDLVIHKMGKLNYYPSFDDFKSEDWIEI